VNSAGQVVQLRGVNLSGTEFACDQNSAPPYGWSIFGFTYSSTMPTIVQSLHAWGVNTVRVPLNEDCWLGINSVNPAYGGSTYQSAITQEVNDLHTAGFAVLLDLHWNAPGPFPAQSQNPVPDEDHSVSFWKSVATSFLNDPAVIFELYNEPFIYGSYLQNPNADTWQCWLNGCTFTQFVTGGNPYTRSYTWQSAGMQQLVDTIRATGATQPIQVNGLNWANDMSGWLAHLPLDPQKQLVAGWHSYPGELCAAQSCWDSTVAPIAAQFPVNVSETGDSVCSAITYVNQFLPWADQHGISYQGWTFNPWSDCNDVLLKDWNGTPTTNYGQYFHDHLVALAGVASPTPSTSPTASASSSPPPTSTPPAQGRIHGGINAMPSIRTSHGNYPNPDGWFCLPPNCYQNPDPTVTISRELTLAKQLGVANVRVDFPMILVEPQRGVFDWSRSDYIVNAAAAHGVVLNPILDVTATWAAAAPNLAPSPADWSAYVSAFVGRYRGAFQAVEMWNEPDTGSYWSSGEQAYVDDILKPGYTAAHSADPNIKVVEGGSINDSGACCAWLDGIYAAGGGNFFDIAAFHDYVGNAAAIAQSYQNVLNSHGQGSKPIWLGEYGVQEATTNDQNQIALMKSILQSNAPIALAQWYNLRDDSAMSCCPMAVLHGATWGLVQHDDATLKAGYATMQALLGSGGSPAPGLGPAPTATPTATPTAKPTGTPTATPTPGSPSTTPTPWSPQPPATPTASPTSTWTPPPGSPLFSDTFASDAVGSVPAGWVVIGANPGFAVAGEAGQHVYAHNGWTATSSAGNSSWTNYSLDVAVKPSAWQSETDGVDVRYRDAQDFYRVRFTGGNTIVFGRVLNNGTQYGAGADLGAAAFAYAGGAWYELTVIASGNTFTIEVNGKTVLTAVDSSIPSGRIAFDANSPVEYGSVTVNAA
jgi:hypothetical protein